MRLFGTALRSVSRQTGRLYMPGLVGSRCRYWVLWLWFSAVGSSSLETKESVAL